MVTTPIYLCSPHATKEAAYSSGHCTCSRDFLSPNKEFFRATFRFFCHLLLSPGGAGSHAWTSPQLVGEIPSDVILSTHEVLGVLQLLTMHTFGISIPHQVTQKRWQNAVFQNITWQWHSSTTTLSQANAQSFHAFGLLFLSRLLHMPHLSSKSTYWLPMPTQPNLTMGDTQSSPLSLFNGLSNELICRNLFHNFYTKLLLLFPTLVLCEKTTEGNKLPLLMAICSSGLPSLTPKTCAITSNLNYLPLSCSSSTCHCCNGESFATLCTVSAAVLVDDGGGTIYNSENVTGIRVGGTKVPGNPGWYSASPWSAGYSSTLIFTITLWIHIKNDKSQRCINRHLDHTDLDACRSSRALCLPRWSMSVSPCRLLSSTEQSRCTW